MHAREHGHGISGGAAGRVELSARAFLAYHTLYTIPFALLLSLAGERSLLQPGRLAGGHQL